MAAPSFISNDRFVQKVELRISCKNLPQKDVMSKSDPCAILYCLEGTKFKEIARTENIKNDLNPDFSTPLGLDYYFETVQKVRIRLYDVDNSTETMKDDDFLGQIETTLGEIVSNSPFSKTLTKKKGEAISESYITITAEEVKGGTELALLTFKAMKLDNKDFMGKSDPFVELSRMQPDGSWQLVYRSEVVKNDLNPNWRPFYLRVNLLCCGGNRATPIKITVFDWDSDGSHDLIGFCTTTMDEMAKANDSAVTWPCINEKKKEKKKNYKDSGQVILSHLMIQKQYSFLDYIFGGMQMSMTIGVDFTGSNGHPQNPASLHFVNSDYPNQYMQAISSVGAVLQDYDSDKMFPALGFGALIPPRFDKTNFEFPLNYNPDNPYCAGIQGVLDAYMSCIKTVQLSGPTMVSPIFNHVIRFARHAQSEEASKGAHSYLILLLLTDGVLNDMNDVRNALVEASGLPMSVIIVGVGDANFDDMNQLDGDDGLLRANDGRTVLRDIVQFVPFRKFQTSSASELSRHVLAEIPSQVTQYFRMRGLTPRNSAQQPQTGM